MSPDDFVETEVGVAMAVVAVLFSPRVRGLLRRGLAHGLGTLLSAPDLIGAAARAFVPGTRQGDVSITDGLEDIRAQGGEQSSAQG